MNSMDEQDFQKQSDAAIEDLYRRLAEASDAHGFDVDLNAGALTVEFEEPRERFVVSPNSPVRQIWVSAQVRSFKFDWNPQRGAFVLPETGETLVEMMAAAVSRRLGETVTL